MDDILSTGLAALLAGLLGSIPFGLLLTRAAGLGDIRSIGSGNIGATNVLRTGKKWLAAGTLLLDFGKGVLAVVLVTWLFGAANAPMAALAAVLGHCHPPWLGGKGGKGVATALGVFLGLGWGVFVAAAAGWIVGAATSRISSVGALSAMVVAAITAFLVLRFDAAVAITIIAVYVVMRHEANIQRLITRTEPRIGQGK
ncbi:glycerol-3-phosphate 1-O-acyltransferase PlsY [Sediminicoccus rosea]|uniref:Glycerol-3-phosphate acyltransferase n=1 Tax=Sediminicoccus rosea TaxID=1225128 RepID=A0ABZ0PMA4_9PROT|nr:glycerol-3-phosphate 1-O-acyltransferase PlsY [Sediminicoccus rosea]WPB86591.1 glycerol-3-phosphate 1-O-acyltransferase PlsY [Sediminicoccus rosea]